MEDGELVDEISDDQTDEEDEDEDHDRDPLNLNLEVRSDGKQKLGVRKEVYEK